MCLVKTKTYVFSDGAEQTIERVRYCDRTHSGTLCDTVDYQSEVRPVERKPHGSSSGSSRASSGDGGGGVMMVTKDRNGRERLSRQYSRRSGKRPDREKPVAGSSSQAASPTSLAGASIREIRPSAPTPPPTGAQYPPTLSSRCPRDDCPMMSGALPLNADLPTSPIRTSIVTPDSVRLARRSSFSSTSAEPGDVAQTEEAGPSKSRNRKRVSITIPFRTKSATVETASPKHEARRTKDQTPRYDSAKGFPSMRTTDSSKPRPVDPGLGRSTQSTEEEEARQARLESARYASREVQRAQNQASASADRHRRTTDAAENARRTAEINAREAEVERERERRIASEIRSAEQERIEADRQVLNQEWTHRRSSSYEHAYSPRSPCQPSSPLSPRHQLQSRPAIHQEVAVTYQHRDADPLRTRGSDVIAREQARLARDGPRPSTSRSPHTERLLEDAFAHDDVGGEIEVAERVARNERHRRYHEQRRPSDRDREFWR